VHFVPSQPESLQQIISKYVEKEGKIASLLKYSEQQNDEIRHIQSEMAEAQAKVDASGTGEEGAAAASKAADGAGGKQAKKVEAHERAEQSFEAVCTLLQSMYRMAKCQGGQDLETKGCSSSTVNEFMSAVATRLDSLQMVAGTMREHALNYRGAVRKSNEVFEGFLKPQLLPLGEEQPSDMVKRMLPSMSDQGPDQDGETDQQERARTRDARKGTIDRHKRDEVISAWVQKQKQMRGAVTARGPTIRSYYDEETKSFFENRKRIYPPATART